MDNDCKNEPDSAEYLDQKRDAITKAVKGESLDQNNTFKYEPNSEKDELSGTANEALDAIDKLKIDNETESKLTLV